MALGEPKTKKSRRTIHLTEVAIQTLRAHLERQLEKIEQLGDAYQDQGLVFTTEAGTLINPTNLRKRSFAPLLKRAACLRYDSTASGTHVPRCSCHATSIPNMCKNSWGTPPSPSP